MDETTKSENVFYLTIDDVPCRYVNSVLISADRSVVIRYYDDPPRSAGGGEFPGIMIEHSIRTHWDHVELCLNVDRYYDRDERVEAELKHGEWLKSLLNERAFNVLDGATLNVTGDVGYIIAQPGSHVTWSGIVQRLDRL